MEEVYPMEYTYAGNGLCRLWFSDRVCDGADVTLRGTILELRL